jgi:hypothetical protein
MLVTCQNAPVVSPVSTLTPASVQNSRIQPAAYPEGSWQDFLRHLPTADKPILDYRGRPIENQAKHVEILTYDVGTADLQQCADALIRIRAEYLFAQGRHGDIGFHFTGGGYYSFADYSKGIRPVNKGGRLAFLYIAPPSEKTHQELRKYLNIVYMYANTISLCKELKPADRFETGTVIIHPGSPGHCSLIIDEAVVGGKDTVYKLAEGFMPAQSIYILSNPYEPQLNPWYHLHKGTITTVSFEFQNYYLRKFE